MMIFIKNLKVVKSCEWYGGIKGGKKIKVIEIVFKIIVFFVE